ncbi:hypothetical protein [Deinococcus budaensis]|uniref:DUF4402 domain-containing protein n=1 Tax=Deinococcus budaensis TaxID=1665626 RepID=A0A7W8GEV8_9DEIO|nr:hypothetical protein [Deinococcus budaensis]MBB5234074.1 hypothetical protein [Deinococcus budaensis]
MKRRAAALLLCGVLGATPPGLAQTVTLPVAQTAPVAGTPLLLLDGQRLTLKVAFRPGDRLGPAYPPAGPFSRAHPAYYPMQAEEGGGGGPLRLTVATSLPRAVLVLRAQPVPPVAGGSALPADRIEYSVNGAPWQPSRGLQVVALLPAGGQATFEIALRLRLEGDEPAGVGQIQLSWTVEAQ